MPGRRKKSRRKQPVDLSNNDVDVDDDDPDRVWCSCGRPFGTDGFMIFFPGLDGLPLPTTPSTKKARAGQLNKKDQIAKSLKVPVLINAAHLRRGIRGAMRDGPTSTYAHCS